MNKNITIANIAEELGISKTTVSRAISGKGRISEATRQRVREYMEENNYKPNVIAQGLAKSKTYNIGVVMPSDYGLEEMSYFQNCLVGLQEMASIYEYDIILTVCNNNDLGQLKRIISNGKVDGVILMRTLIEDEAVKLLLEQEFPFVVIGMSGHAFIHPSIIYLPTNLPMILSRWILIQSLYVCMYVCMYVCIHSSILPSSIYLPTYLPTYL